MPCFTGRAGGRSLARSTGPRLTKVALKAAKGCSLREVDILSNTVKQRDAPQSDFGKSRSGVTPPPAAHPQVTNLQI
jgi:hypothetical protein